jgi:hypothetical protein
MGTASRPPGKAMYVAPRPDWDWLRIEQRKLYTRSDPTGWLRPAGLSSLSIMESRVHNERCTPGSEGGARKPTGVSRQGAGRLPYPTRNSARQAPHRTRAKPLSRMPQSSYAPTALSVLPRQKPYRPSKRSSHSSCTSA